MLSASTATDDKIIMKIASFRLCSSILLDFKTISSVRKTVQIADLQQQSCDVEREVVRESAERWLVTWRQDDPGPRDETIWEWAPEPEPLHTHSDKLRLRL